MRKELEHRRCCIEADPDTAVPLGAVLLLAHSDDAPSVAAIRPRALQKAKCGERCG